MSAERNIAEELDNILTCIKKAEQKIIAYDSPDKLKIVSKLVGLEDSGELPPPIMSEVASCFADRCR